MQQIPIAAKPNQSLTIRLGGSVYRIDIKAARGVMAVSIARDGITLADSVRAVSGSPLLPYRYQEAGNFAFVTLNNENPWYSLFGKSQSLVFASEAEIQAIRDSGGILNSLGIMPLRYSPAKYSLADFIFITGEIPALASFARSSIATENDRSGLIATKATNEPRFDYDPVAHVLRGLLIEKSSRNLWTRSNAIGGTDWFNGGPLASLTLNYGIAPDGTQTSTRLVGTDTNDGHCMQVKSVTEGITYTGSFWARGTGTGRIKFQKGGGDFLNYAFEDFTATPLWTRYSVTGVKSVDSYSLRFGISRIAAGDDIEVWGAQVEEGSLATSYIPTAASAITRAADQLSFTIPFGVSALRYTFDDNSIQEVSVSEGAYTVPTNLNRKWIKSIGFIQ